MTNFFTFAVNETTSGSIYYLSSVFGTVGSLLTGTGPAILATMFKVFNTAVLAVGTLIISYTTGVSILLTAQEGEMLGKKFHSLWVPLRTVMGMAALVPSAGGYSYLQIGMMWFILQGVGAADTLWSTTVNYINAGNSTAPASQAVALTNLTSIKNKMGTLFSGLACQAADKAAGITTSGYICTGGTSDTTPIPTSWCGKADMLSITPGSSQVSNGVYTMGATGECGTLTLGENSAIGTAQNSAYQQIVQTFGDLAAQLVVIDDGFATFVNSGILGTPTSAPPAAQAYCASHAMNSCTPSDFSGFLPSTLNTNASTQIYLPYWQQSVGDFVTAAATLYSATLATANPLTTATTNSTDTETANGWIFAGAYFYDFIKQNVAASSVKLPTVSAPNSVISNPKTSVVTKEAGDIVAAINSALGPTSSTGPNASLTGWGSGCTIFGALCNIMIDGWMSTLSGSNGMNPIVNAQIFGTVLLSTVEIAVPILFAFAAGAFGLISTIILGNGVPGEGLALEFVVLPIFFFFAVIFLGIGATLAVYTPMIPYMLFAFGAINWIVATIETMIAAPIVAIGLLYPEGTHEIWGKTEHAIMLVLNIFLRPSLMIFGMIAAMLLSYVAVSYINQGFLSVVESVATYMSFTEGIFFMVLYTSIFTTTLNKCFELIHVVPDKILRWIGGGQEQFGGEGAAGGVEKVGQGFQSGVQKGESGVQKAEQKAGERAAMKRKQQEAFDRKKSPQSQSSVT